MKLKQINDKIKNKIFVFNDSFLEIHFLQIDFDMKWIKFSFHDNPDDTFIILFDKLLDQIYNNIRKFENCDFIQIQNSIFQKWKTSNDKLNENESNGRKHKINTRDIIISSIPDNELNLIIQKHISSFKNDIKFILDILTERNQFNEVTDIYGIGSNLQCFSRFGLPDRINENNVIMIDEPIRGKFYTFNEYNISQNAEVWYNAINPISWFGVRMNEGEKLASENLKIASKPTDFDWKFTTFSNIEDDISNIENQEDNQE